MLRPLLVALVASLVALSGCSGGGSDSPDAPGEGGGPGGTDADESRAVIMQAPTWTVGENWVHHWYVGNATSDNPFDFTLTAIVSASDGDGWKVSAGDLESSIFHAAFFFPDLGTMGKEFTMESAEFSYPWYSFPLEDNKTWKAKEVNLDFDLQPVERELTLKATWVPPAAGVVGHYVIEARDGANLRARYDYRPDLAWFSEYRAYGDGVTDNLEAYVVRVQAETHATDYNGAFFDAESELFIADVTVNVPSSGEVTANPVASFEMGSTMTHMFAIQAAFAATGASSVEIVAPNGERYGFEAVDANVQQVVQGADLVIAPAQAGTWNVVRAGASPLAWGSVLFAWGMTVTEGTL